MANNVITATFPSSMGSQLTYADPVYQYDYGMILQFVGLSLPMAYEVHFANTDSTGNSITQIGNEDGVSVPDELLLTGKTVYAWVYLHSTVDDGETVYKVVIPVNRRARPTNATPTPVQQDVITEAIAALDAAVEEAQAAVEAIQDMGVDAEQLPAGSEPTVTKTVDPETGVVTLTFGLVDGEQGETGVGIQSISWNPDYTMTVTMTNGTTYTSGNLRGPTGAPGNGIASAVLNQNYTLTLTFTDGTSYTTPSIRGAQGEQGIQGIPGADGQSASITGASASVDANVGTPSVAVTAGGTALARSFDFAFHNLKGQPGQDGISPVITVTEITGGHEVAVTDAEGTQTFEVLDGEVSEEELETALADKADVITSSTSGEIVTIADGANNLPVLDLSLSLLPVQDLHGQDAPYPAGGGKNMLNPKLYVGGAYDPTVGTTWTLTESTKQFTANADNSVFTLTTSSTWESYVLLVPVVAGGVYKLTGSISSSGTLGTSLGYLTTNYEVMQKTNSTSASQTWSYSPTPTAENVGYYYICITNRTTASVTITLTKPQFESGSSATAYAPYENVCPISGWTGVDIHQAQINLLDPNDPDYGLYTINSTGGYVTTTPDRITTGYIPCKQGDVVTLDTDEKLGTGSYKIPFGGFAWYDENKTFLSRSYTDNANSFSAIAPSGARFFRMFEQIPKLASVSSPSVYQTYGQRVYIGSGVTENLPYSTTYPISWQTEVGTVYGGSLDVTTGVLTVTHHYQVLTGTEPWALNSTYYRFSVIPSNGFPSKAYGQDIISNKLDVTGFNSNRYCGIRSTQSVLWQDATELKADLASWYANNDPAYLVYLLDTPTTYQLTPTQISTLLGTNNFWSNGNGTLDLEYRADTKLYIEQLTKPSEDDMTANQNITASSFFMVGNRLFLSTVAIGQGEAIVPGTNCSEVSLADALNSLNS